jgi:hypothetical protein
MDSTRQGGRSLELVGGGEERRLDASRRCADLLAGYRQFTSGAEKSLQPGMLAQWKPGMKNRKMPEYGVPMVVVEILAEPIVDATFDSGSIYYRERLDVILGFIDGDDRDFSVLHYDSRRFEPYKGIGLESN